MLWFFRKIDRKRFKSNFTNLYNPHRRYKGENRQAIEPTVTRVNEIIYNYAKKEDEE